ncbi:MAG: phosphatidylinositol mannoside acyltransferase, partial [Acidimicrobiales bacterium]
MGIPCTAVVERLDPPELFEWFVDYRRSIGLNVVPVGPGAAAEVARAVKERHVVCLLSDRDVTGHGVEVEFFGERTTLPAGPAALALRTGTSLMPAAIYFQKALRHGKMCAPLE